MPRIVDVLDAARMSAHDSKTTTLRVSQYFGDAGPFSYGKVRSLAGILLTGAVAYPVAIAGLNRITFELAKKCNLDVAKLLNECKQFRGRSFYKIKRKTFTIDRDFAVGLRPEAVIVVDGIPNIVFLQPRKTATPWPYNTSFMRRIVEETFQDYYDEAKYWLVDTEALEGSDRELRVVDLSLAPPMSDREFTRRISSLRRAWRLHLTAPRPIREPRKDDEDRQSGFDFGDE